MLESRSRTLSRFPAAVPRKFPESSEPSARTPSSSFERAPTLAERTPVDSATIERDLNLKVHSKAT